MKSRFVLGLALLATPMVGAGAQVRLSLTDALARADSASEAVAIARASATKAEADRLRARSALLPQLNGSASYSRTIKSQFAGFALDTMSLLGLSLAIGILIDDAIVVRENIVRLSAA